MRFFGFWKKQSEKQPMKSTQTVTSAAPAQPAKDSGEKASPQGGEPVFRKLFVPTVYELADETYIHDLMHVEFGNWNQYEVLIAARGYGWQDMLRWADYMSKHDLRIDHTSTLTISPVSGSTTSTELIAQFLANGKDISKMPELEREQGVLALGGWSERLHTFVKIVWMNQTHCLRLFIADRRDDELMRRYIETLLRWSFGTPDEMKLAKPLPEIQQ